MLMAGKTEATQAPPKEVDEHADTMPLLDLSDAAVKKLIGTAQKRGYVTPDQLKSVGG
jgi:RNA polymerase primary sigma factor